MSWGGVHFAKYCHLLRGVCSRASFNLEDCYRINSFSQLERESGGGWACSNSTWTHLFRKVREEWNRFSMGDHFEKGQHALLNEGEENERVRFQPDSASFHFHCPASNTHSHTHTHMHTHSQTQKLSHTDMPIHTHTHTAL